MKKWIIVVTVLAVPLLTYACGPSTPTPDVQATVDARVAQIARETAIAQVQTDLAAEQTAVAATQTAIAQAQADLAAEQTAAAATQTAITQAQTDPAAEQTAVAATQMAMAVSTDTTLTPSSATSSPTVPTTPPGDLCPFYVYDAWGSDKNHYVPAGFMGDQADAKLDDNFKLDPDPSRLSVIQITYTPRGAEQWAGIYWWDPPGAIWGNIDGGFNLSCATKLTFWGRGEHGEEKAEFKVGGLEGTYKDSLQPAPSTGPIVLTDTWVQYTLDLSGRDLSHIIGGFVWVTNKPSNPGGATIYLDDIRFE